MLIINASEKIDRRISYYLVMDTETANSLEDPMVYDVGGVITDKRGTIYHHFSFVNRDVFYGMADIMVSSYYANKLPKYREQINSGERVLASFYEIRDYIHRLCSIFGVKAIIAHNARFDYKACSTTQRYLTKSKYRFFFPYGIEIWDTLKMAQDTICKQKRYIKYCEENDYFTKQKKPQPRATAEILYRYITKNQTFDEDHTAHEDAEIEAQIFAHCMKQHKAMRKKCFGN